MVVCSNLCSLVFIIIFQQPLRWKLNLHHRATGWFEPGISWLEMCHWADNPLSMTHLAFAEFKFKRVKLKIYFFEQHISKKQLNARRLRNGYKHGKIRATMNKLHLNFYLQTWSRWWCYKRNDVTKVGWIQCHQNYVFVED